MRYCIDDYIVEVLSDSINFGLKRGGHSGGYWYRTTVTELNNKLLFTGKIEYIDSFYRDSRLHKVMNVIGEVLLFIFFLPVILVFKLYQLIELLIKKIKRLPIVKEVTAEDRLYNLMENLLHCVHK